MSAKRGKRNQFVELFDGWLIPIAFGVFGVFILVQAISLIPHVRTAIDAMEGRFVATPTVAVPAAVKRDSAVVVLTANNVTAAKGVEVFLDGASLGRFTTDQMRITVRDGDRIKLVDHGARAATITVDTSDPNLLLPAPGQTVTLDAKEPQAALSKTEFI